MSTFKNQVVIKDIHLGGIADTKYSGLPNSVYRMQGLDIHEEPGIIKVHQDVVLDRVSGVLLDADVVNIVPTAIGQNGYTNSEQTYFFQENGKVIRRNNAANYSLSFTTAQSNCRDAAYFNGWIFFTTSTEVGFFSAGDATVRQDSISTIQSTEPLQDKNFHPLHVVENDLYLGDGNRVHRIEVEVVDGTGTISSSGATITGSGTDFVPELKEGFVIRAVTSGGKLEDRTVIANPSSDTSASINAPFSTNVSAGTTFKIIRPRLVKDVLVLDNRNTIQVLSDLVTHLIIGTAQEGQSAGSFSDYSRVINWDTRSIDLVSDVIIPEFGVNCIMSFFGRPIIQAGTNGNLYTYDGQRCTRYKKLPGNWSRGNEAKINRHAYASYLGITAFGVSNIANNPMPQGVYTIGGYDAKYPAVFNLDFTRSLETDNINIGALAMIGEDLVYAQSRGGSEVVYRIDGSNKSEAAFLETQVFNAARERLKNYEVIVCYRSLPAGSSITIAEITNDEGGYQTIASTVYSNRKVVKTNVQVVNAATVQFRVFINRGTNTNTAPEVESILINFNVEK